MKTEHRMAAFNSLMDEAFATAVEHGFHGTPEMDNIPTKIALVHSELSEALEEFRDGHPMDLHGHDPEFNVAIPYRPGMKPEGFITEVADAVIRIADLAGMTGTDLARAIEVKMAYNAKRPMRHGGKAI